MYGFNLYKARVVDVGENGNDMIQVRIIPDQLGVPDKQRANLPWFAPFYKGAVLHCKTELSDNKEADLVWVMATEGFRYGYVLDKANVTGDINGDNFGGESYNYNEVTKHWTRNGMSVDDIPYEDMKVVFASFTEDGGIIQLYNFRNGCFILMNSSGSCITMSQSQIVLRAGSPDSDFTKITMSPTKIQLDGAVCHINCKDVITSMHGMKMALVPEGAPPVGIDGISLFPAENVSG